MAASKMAYDQHRKLAAMQSAMKAGSGINVAAKNGQHRK
jgi:hypothetical protein